MERSCLEGIEALQAQRSATPSPIGNAVLEPTKKPILRGASIPKAKLASSSTCLHTLMTITTTKGIHPLVVLDTCGETLCS